MLFNDHQVGQADVLKSADTAMYLAKESGPGNIRFFGEISGEGEVA